MEDIVNAIAAAIEALDDNLETVEQRGGLALGAWVESVRENMLALLTFLAEPEDDAPARLRLVPNRD